MYYTIPQMIYEKNQEMPSSFIQYSKDENGNFQGITYSEFTRNMLNFAAGLSVLGEEANSHVGLICDNRKEWHVCSMGIMALGGADIPRGSEATALDLGYILGFSECTTTIVENKVILEKILEVSDDLPKLENIIILDDSPSLAKKTVERGFNYYTYGEILLKGEQFRNFNPGIIESVLLSGKLDDTATIIFTSGTTGKPKGVELLQKNFLCQLEPISKILPLEQGDKALQVLPIWHVYERALEYILLFIGASLSYSKPVASILMADLQKVQPQFLAVVPRVWEAVYKGIQKKIKDKSRFVWHLYSLCKNSSVCIRKMQDIIKERNHVFKRSHLIARLMKKVLYIPILFLLPFRALGKALFFKKALNVFGGKFKIGVSGGGGLPSEIDYFYNSIGVQLVEGYGLTETAPVCCLRDYKNPVIGSIGKVLPYCQAKIVNEKGNECNPGEMGVLYIKGVNVMKGYYKSPELTASVFDKDGWFNTGDLVEKTFAGELIVKGRQKDTIVLKSGENVEPYPLEAKLSESPFISQAVIVGQDKNCLGALILPSKDEIKRWADENNIFANDMDELLSSHEIQILMHSELERLITAKNGFKPFEKIGKFCFLKNQFQVGVELSAKQDLMRHRINEIYKKQISSLFA